MRKHDKDWAGLVLATSRRTVTVKPLEVLRDDDDEKSDDETKTAEVRLRIAHAYPMKRVDGSAIMERLTFAPDGVGAVARRNERADAPPMLTRKYRVDVTSAERAMVGAESPERARGVVDDAIEDDGDDGDGVSESVYSLFEVHRGESSIDESPPEDVGEIEGGGEIEGESLDAFEPAPHADESGDSISPERLGIIRRESRSADGGSVRIASRMRRRGFRRDAGRRDRMERIDLVPSRAARRAGRREARARPRRRRALARRTDVERARLVSTTR